MVENIRIERGRVNITEQKDNEEDESKVSGGWLLEIDNYKNEKQIELYDGEGKLIKITYHSPEQLSQVQYDYLTVFLNDINNSIKDYNKNPTGWEDYIDIDELTKFYIVQEIMENPEAFCGSCWMHKDYGDDAKLKFGPVWDLEAGFYYRDTPNFIIDPIVEGYKYKQRWITEIIDSPRLQYRIKKLWNDFCDKTLIDDFVYNSYYEIYDAIQKDHIRWPQYNNSYTEESLSLFLERYTNKNIFLHEQWDEQATRINTIAHELKVTTNPNDVVILGISESEIKGVYIVCLNGMKKRMQKISSNKYSLYGLTGVCLLQIQTNENTYTKVINIPKRT